MSDPYDPITGQGAFDMVAEQALLGLMLLNPEAVAPTLLTVEPSDYYKPAHQSLAGILIDMVRAGTVIAPDTTLSRVQALGLLHSLPGHYILTLVQRATVVAAAPEHAARIRELAGRRLLSEAGTRLAQWMDDASDNSAVTEGLAEIRAACDRAEAKSVGSTELSAERLDRFLIEDAEQDRYDWLVPNLLERGDRLVFTGSEGAGKSWATSQIATAIAANLHPFQAFPLNLRPARVLILDCENSPRQTRRRLGLMRERVQAVRLRHNIVGDDWQRNMFVECRPGGVDLLSSADKAWFQSQIVETSPDLLVIGPMYKLHRENPSDETAARALVWVLDQMRERHGFTLIIEGHAGNALEEGGRSVRPIGSSLFRRWPEFGFGMRASQGEDEHSPMMVDLVRWRGEREQRDWPYQLARSALLPWMPV